MKTVPHNRLTYGDLEMEAIAEVVRSGYWACGPRVGQLEKSLACRAGTSRAVCVASGSAALRLALRGLGVKPGDRVLIPAYCCVALANAVLACGANPVPVDISPDDWNLDVQVLPTAVARHRPRAIVVVNTFGVPANLDRLRSYGLPIVEDCAHAFGLRVGSEWLGGRADAAVLSFYATKLIAGGEGGAVLTNSAALADFIEDWRDYTDRQPGPDRFNDKMTDLEAAAALCQLNRLNDMLVARLSRATRYAQLLAPGGARVARYRLPRMTGPRVWYRYAVEMLDRPADAVIEQMQRRGVQAARPVEDWRLAGEPPCPIADRAYERIVSLPLYPTLSDDEQTQVAQAFLETCRESA